VRLKFRQRWRLFRYGSRVCGLARVKSEREPLVVRRYPSVPQPCRQLHFGGRTLLTALEYEFAVSRTSIETHWTAPTVALRTCSPKDMEFLKLSTEILGMKRRGRETASSAHRFSADTVGMQFVGPLAPNKRPNQTGPSIGTAMFSPHCLIPARKQLQIQGQATAIPVPLADKSCSTAKPA
jgi:hypothetical protein